MNRLTYLVKRLLLGVPVILFSLTMVYVIVYVLSPIDPTRVILGMDATPQDVRRLQIALDIRYPNGELVPLWVQYKRFMFDMLTFNFGDSWVLQRNTPVTELIIGRMPATLWLGLWSVLIALIVGIPVGLFAGLNANTWSDYTASAGGIVWRAMPNFWLAVMISSVLSAGGLLSGYRDFLIKTDVIGTPDEVANLFSFISPFEGIPILELVVLPVPELFNIALAFKWILPAALVLGSSSMGNEVRIGRTAVLESINSDYVDTAKAKGVPARRIITKHVGRNAILPLLPVIMGEFYLLIGGSVLVESVFSINGLGLLFLQAAFSGDLPVLITLAFLFAIILIVFNITQDLLYTYIDPRIAFEEEGG